MGYEWGADNRYTLYCTSVCGIRPLLCFSSQHMSRSQNLFFLGLPFRFHSVTPTQTSETSSRSQGGVVL